MSKIVEFGKIKNKQSLLLRNKQSLLLRNKNGKKVKEFVLSILSEFGFSYNPKLDGDLDSLESFYQKPGSNFWLLIDNEEIVGTVGIEKKDRKTAELKRFYLKRRWRGKGWGEKLFKRTLLFCQRKGYQILITETTQKNQKAISFLKRAGFKIKKQKGISLYFSKELMA